MAKHRNTSTIRTVLVFFVVFLIATNLVFAISDSTDIIVKSPYQVKPGGSLPIIITVTHDGSLQANLNLTGLSGDVFLQKVSSLESESKKDTLAIESVEILLDNESVRKLNVTGGFE